MKERRARWGGPAALAALVVSGLVKANPLFAWLPVDLTLLTAALVAIAIVVSLVRDGAPHRLIWVPLALWVLFSLSLVPAEGVPWVDVDKHITLFTVTFLLAVAPFFLLRYQDQRIAFGWATAVVGLVAVLLMFTNQTTVEGYASRYVLEGSNSIATARVVCAGALVVLLAAFHARPARAVLLFFAGAVLVVASIASGSRGPIIAAGVALAITIILAPGLRKYRGRALVALVLAGIVGFFVARSVVADGFARIWAYFSGERDESVAAREALSGAAWDSILQNPFGTGWGTFTMSNHLYRYPHNIVLEVFAEAGWITGVVFVGLMVIAGVRLLKLSDDQTMIPMLALFIFSVLNAVVSSDINGNRLLIVTMFAAFAVPLAARVEETTVTPQLARVR